MSNLISHKDQVLQSARHHDIHLSQEALLLIHGVKPAILTSFGKVHNKRKEMLQFLQSFYPSIGFPHRGNGFMIFNKPEDMIQFVQIGVKSIPSRVRDSNLLDYDFEQLGIYLGYPPQAAKWFAENSEKVNGKIPKRSPVNYHGIQFVCEPGTVEECISWMEIHRPVPEELQRIRNAPLVQ